MFTLTTFALSTSHTAVTYAKYSGFVLAVSGDVALEDSKLVIHTSTPDGDALDSCRDG